MEVSESECQKGGGGAGRRGQRQSQEILCGLLRSIHWGPVITHLWVVVKSGDTLGASPTNTTHLYSRVLSILWHPSGVIGTMMRAMVNPCMAQPHAVYMWLLKNLPATEG